MRNIERFWSLYFIRLHDEMFKNLRKGQLYFSCLYDVDTELANKIRGDSNTDPFYVDARIPKFFEVIHKEWNLI